MSEHLLLIMLVLALATGMVTSVVTTNYIQPRQPKFSRYFLTNLLLFNLLILSGLVLRYLQLSFQMQEIRPNALVFPGLLVMMAVLKLGWLYAFIIMNKSLLADMQQKRLSVTLIKSGVVIFSAYMVLMAAAWLMSMDSLRQAGIISLEVIVIGGALVAALQLILAAFKLPRGGRRKSILVFGSYHLALFGIILSVMVTGWFQDGPQDLAQLVVNAGFLILYNVFPLIWIQWLHPLQPVSDFERFESLGITNREVEVIKLIQAGKTNQEIADELFISVATVKDHNHNIFKKCDVRNRLELSNLFR